MHKYAESVWWSWTCYGMCLARLGSPLLVVLYILYVYHCVCRIPIAGLFSTTRSLWKLLQLNY